MAVVTGSDALTKAYEYTLVEFGKTVDDALRKWGGSVYEAVIKYITLLIALILLIWIMWQGYKFLFDAQKPSLQKLIWDLLKAGIVLSVALSLDRYEVLIVHGITNLDAWLIDMTQVSTDSNIWITVNSLWDKGWESGQKFLDACTNGISAWSPSTYITGALGVLGYIGLLIFSGSILFGATLTLLISKFNIVLLVAAGPVFLACAFADETRYVAVGWFKSLLSALLTIFFLVLTMSLVNGLLTPQWTMLINAANSSAESLALGNGDSIGKIMVCFKLIFLIGISSLAICMVMCSLNKIAQGLVGGQSLGAGGWGAVTPFMLGSALAIKALSAPLKQLGKAGMRVAGKAAGTVARVGGIATMGAAGMAGAATAAGAKAAAQTFGAVSQGVARASQSSADSGASGSSSGSGDNSGGTVDSSRSGDAGGTGSGSGSPSGSGGAGGAGNAGGVGSTGSPSGTSPSSSGSPSGNPGSSNNPSMFGGSSGSGNSSTGGASGNPPSSSSGRSAAGSAASTYASNVKSNFADMTSDKPYSVLNQGWGAATTVGLGQALRMGALNASTSKGIVGQVAGVASGLMEKGVAEVRYAGVIRSAQATGKEPTMSKPDSIGKFMQNPLGHANEDLKPFKKSNYRIV